MAVRTEGLRQRKKRATREAIAAAARGLFAERGFDAVTVAEVAAAADVSEKTVFNHFATKEDLAFAGGEGPVSQLLADLAQRPAGTPVLAVFRATTDAMIASLAATSERDELLAVTEIVSGSRFLQDRLPVKWEREYEALTAAIAETAPAGDGDVIPEIVARTLWWTHRTIFRTALAGLLAGENPEELAARLRAIADRAYGRVADGLADYGKGD
jgi:AcrR family transcriptional regulator